MSSRSWQWRNPCHTDTGTDSSESRLGFWTVPGSQDLSPTAYHLEQVTSTHCPAISTLYQLILIFIQSRACRQLVTSKLSTFKNDFFFSLFSTVDIFWPCRTPSPPQPWIPGHIKPFFSLSWRRPNLELLSSSPPLMSRLWGKVSFILESPNS